MEPQELDSSITMEPQELNTSVIMASEEGETTIDQQYFRDIVSSLPSFDAFIITDKLYYQNGWYATMPIFIGSMVTQKFFKARPTDILLASFPKSGTTWLKALLFAVANRGSHNDALLTYNPHDCIPFLEVQVYGNDSLPDVDSIPSPRIFATHIPIQSLPGSVVESGCRIVYLCRCPKDNFVSLWHMINAMRAKIGIESLTVEDAFDHFCNGQSVYGPFGDHVLGYWKASLEKQHKYSVLFMKYEELMKHPVAELKRMAEFVGCPFTVDEDKDRVPESIIKLCGFDNLSKLEVNKIGTMNLTGFDIDNKLFFRRGVVGDWMNHLSPELAKRLDAIMDSKFKGYDITFN